MSETGGSGKVERAPVARLRGWCRDYPTVVHVLVPVGVTVTTVLTVIDFTRGCTC